MPWDPTLSLKIHNPGLAVSPGIHLTCYGPFTPPDEARTLRTMLPQVDMSIVHHLIVFGGKGDQRGQQPGNSHLCYQVSISSLFLQCSKTFILNLRAGQHHVCMGTHRAELAHRPRFQGHVYRWRWLCRGAGHRIRVDRTRGALPAAAEEPK